MQIALHPLLLIAGVLLAAGAILWPLLRIVKVEGQESHTATDELISLVDRLTHQAQQNTRL